MVLKNKLITEGYDESRIRIALETIRQYRSSSIPKSIEKKSMYRIEQILKRKSIFVVILRETLIHMLNTWNNEGHGKVAENNLPLYISACTSLLQQTNELLK